MREGAPIYAAKCASCHGAKGEGASADRLAGRNSGDSFAYAMDPKLVRTVGSYWPYATTLFDYTSRAMPFPRPGTLTADETYALVAYILFLNDVVKEDAVMDAASLPKVVMPAHDKFVLDNRTGGKSQVNCRSDHRLATRATRARSRPASGCISVRRRIPASLK